MKHDEIPQRDPDPAQTEAAARQEQVIERSPGAPDSTRTVIEERTVATNTQSSGGLSGGAPGGGPATTPERGHVERRQANTPASDTALPADDATLNTKI
jgi:hypothetical protein